MLTRETKLLGHNLQQEKGRQVHLQTASSEVGDQKMHLQIERRGNVGGKRHAFGCVLPGNSRVGQVKTHD